MLEILREKGNDRSIVSRLGLPSPACAASRFSSAPVLVRKLLHARSSYRKLKVMTMYSLRRNAAAVTSTTGSSKLPPRGAYGCAMMAPFYVTVSTGPAVYSYILCSEARHRWRTRARRCDMISSSHRKATAAKTTV
jgi:hypothetical protein